MVKLFSVLAAKKYGGPLRVGDGGSVIVGPSVSCEFGDCRLFMGGGSSKRPTAVSAVRISAETVADMASDPRPAKHQTLPQRGKC